MAEFDVCWSPNLGQIQTTQVVTLTELPAGTGSPNAWEPKAWVQRKINEAVREIFYFAEKTSCNELSNEKEIDVDSHVLEHKILLKKLPLKMLIK